MMKKFTVKDFIFYNSPCFNCSGDSIFYFLIRDMTESQSYPRFPASFSSKKAIVMPTYTEVELVVHYANNLTIRIDHKTNKFIATSKHALVKYLNQIELSLELRCNKCFAQITSNSIEFNMEKDFINPISLCLESFTIQDAKSNYHVRTYFDSKQTFITTSSPKVKSLGMQLPTLPIYKFKTRAKFLEKIKTYITFS